MAEQPTSPPVVRGTPFWPMRDVYFPMVANEARAQGVPPEVADAVMRVESGYDTAALGGVGERGLMQILPATAAMLGFRGTALELADPATNIRLGTRYLARAWKLADGDLCRALMKYRAGHNEERMSALSVTYCRRAKAHLAALGSPLGAGETPMPDSATASRAADTAPAGGGVKRGRVVAGGSRFWTAHRARIRLIEARLPWRRSGILAGM